MNDNTKTFLIQFQNEMIADLILLNIEEDG
jgi:hypothetical protein